MQPGRESIGFSAEGINWSIAAIRMIPPKNDAALIQWPQIGPNPPSWAGTVRASTPLTKISTNDTYSITPAEKPVEIDRKR